MKIDVIDAVDLGVVAVRDQLTAEAKAAASYYEARERFLAAMKFALSLQEEMTCCLTTWVVEQLRSVSGVKL